MINEAELSQRHSLERLREWENLGYGMFLHFGMSTYDGVEASLGDVSAKAFNPTALDVDQWVSIARDSGMTYAVLTAKHVSGFCLWPSDHTDYHVGNSSVDRDIIKVFTESCRKKGVIPGLYYCSWDNHHAFGSKTPSMIHYHSAFTTSRYQEFQSAQIRELLTRYGEIGEVWVDVPRVLPRGYRHQLYGEIADMQPHSVIMMNSGMQDGSKLNVDRVWPTDLIAIERFLPGSLKGYEPIREVEGETFYIPGEVCDPIGNDWFFNEEDKARSDEELLGMYLVSRARGTNFLLDIGPDKSGRLTKWQESALQRLRDNIVKCGCKDL